MRDTRVLGSVSALISAETNEARFLEARPARWVTAPIERDGRRRCPRDGPLLTVHRAIDGEEWSCLCGYRWYAPGREGQPT